MLGRRRTLQATARRRRLRPDDLRRAWIAFPEYWHSAPTVAAQQLPSANRLVTQAPRAARRSPPAAVQEAACLVGAEVFPVVAVAAAEVAAGKTGGLFRLLLPPHPGHNAKSVPETGCQAWIGVRVCVADA